MRSKLIILALTLALAVPAVSAAGWAAKGHREPDTIRDRDDGFMWPNPSTSGGRKVYLNGFTSQSLGFHAEVGSSFNPNFASVQSERQSWNGRVVAMMGVWRDCNNDGYVGYGDNGLFEYRAEVLAATFGTSICGAQPGTPPNNANNHNFVAAHNDGFWVREFIPIGPDLAASHLKDGNPYDYTDNEAYIWADWNRPGDLPPPNRCYAFHPDGSMRTTGAMLEYADCWDGFLITHTYNSAIAAVDGDNRGFGQLSFKDHPTEQRKSASELNQPNPWGDPSGASYVTAFDCSQPQLAHVQPNTVLGFGVSQPKPPTTNAAGSPAGTVNETGAALNDCNRADNQQGSELEWEAGAANGPYAVEHSELSNTPSAKQQPDFLLDYNEGARPPLAPAAAATNQLGASVSKDPVRLTDTEGFWLGTTVVGEDRNPFVNRATVGSNAFNSVQFLTTYASVSPGAVTTYQLLLNPTNKVGTYGLENCGSNAGKAGASDANGWRCDPGLWWPAGCENSSSCASIRNGADASLRVEVGQPFQLRDVDCYDTSVGVARDLGVHWGALTGTECDIANGL